MKTTILSEKDYVFCNKFNLCVLVLMINYDSEDKYIFYKNNQYKKLIELNECL